LSTSTDHRGLGFAIAALAAILFSFKAILAKWMYRYGVDATTVISLRLLFAGPVFFAIALYQHFKAGAQRLSGKELGLIVVLGFLGYYLSSFLDFLGLEYIPAALERLILFLTPTVVAVLSALFLRKPITTRQWQALLVSYAGMLIVLWDQLKIGGVSAHALAVGSGLCFAATLSYSVYLMMSGEMVVKLGSLRLAALALSISCGLTAVHFALFAKQPLLGHPGAVYQLSLVNAVFCTIIPVFLTMTALRRIGAASSSQLSMLGPISLLFFGNALLGEHLSGLQILGTVVVLAGVSLVVLPTRKASL
jgi:drug/metabolite transporter (DMT)-like permease